MAKNDRLLYLQKIHSDPLFKRFVIDELERIRPSLPSWDSSKDNSDKWKEKSAQMSGFDLALTVLEIKPNRT